MDEQSRYVEFLQFMRKAAESGDLADILRVAERERQVDTNGWYDRAEGWPINSENIEPYIDIKFVSAKEDNGKFYVSDISHEVIDYGGKINANDNFYCSELNQLYRVSWKLTENDKPSIKPYTMPYSIGEKWDKDKVYRLVKVK